MTDFENEVKFTIIKSKKTRFIGAEIGVRAEHIKTGLIAESTCFDTQHQNKVAAIESLKEAIVKDRFSNIDEDDLMDGETFRKELNSGKYD